MDPKIDLPSILAQHAAWLSDYPGNRADLTRADLRGVDLRGVDLRGAVLRGVDLTRADLRDSDLRDSVLCGAGLRGVDLRGVDLRGVDLRDSDLRYADLRCAVLRGADLTRAALPPTIGTPPEEGAFLAWKKIARGRAIQVEIPADAARTGSLVGRKCRAAYVITRTPDVSAVPSSYREATTYTTGEPTRPDAYDPDPRVECTSGIHFFMTRKEAEEYQP